MKKIAIIMGSKSDLPIAEKVIAELQALEIPFEVHIMSAHRTPDISTEFAKSAEINGFGVIISIAGMAAHLGGVIAANTILPVIGIPVGSSFSGFDAMFSTVQMPPGIPVATVGHCAGKNAAILAAEILALSDEKLKHKIISMRKEMKEIVIKNDDEISKIYNN